MGRRADYEVLALHGVSVDLHAIRRQGLRPRRRRIRIQDRPSVGPDQILLAWVRLLTGPRMDDHQVVDDAVPVRVERGEVDAWIREPHGLDDEPIDRTV